MKKMDRRDFIKTGIAGLTGITVMQKGFANINLNLSQNKMVDTVKLGETGLSVSRMAMGTGTRGYNKSSNFTRMGMESFTKLAHPAHCHPVSIAYLGV